MARPTWGLLTALLFAALAVVAAPAASASASKCKRPKHAKVVVKNHLAVVYSRADPSLSETAYWACLQSKGKRFSLTTARNDDISGVSVRNFLFTLRGGFVAYATDQTDQQNGSKFVTGRVFSLRSRLQRRLFTIANPQRDQMGDTLYALPQLLLTTRGYVVWRDSGRATENPVAQDRIGVVDFAGSRIVASAQFGAITALSLTKNVAHWRQAGVAKSFTLEQHP